MPALAVATSHITLVHAAHISHAVQSPAGSCRVAQCEFSSSSSFLLLMSSVQASTTALPPALFDAAFVTFLRDSLSSTHNVELQVSAAKLSVTTSKCSVYHLICATELLR